MIQKGDVLVMNTNSFKGRWVSRFTGSMWSHVALCTGKVFIEHNSTGKERVPIDDLFLDGEFDGVEEMTLVRPPPYVNTEYMVDVAERLFEGARYDHLCLYRLIPKLLNERDKQNLHLFSNGFTCSSLIAYAAKISSPHDKDPLPPYHYSQIIPSDYADRWQRRRYWGDR